VAGNTCAAGFGDPALQVARDLRARVQDSLLPVIARSEATRQSSSTVPHPCPEVTGYLRSRVE